jgi:UDP-glucose 4-epimerase
MARLLVDSGFEVVVLDDLSTGHRDAVGAARFIQGDVGNAALVDAVLAEGSFHAVMHFCARSLVGESVKAPLSYYRNNVSSTLTLLDAMQRHGVDRFVFSSTAAVYGDSVAESLMETHPTRPINPYGRSKLMVEQVLADCAAAYGLSAVALRYFNAAGAHPDGQIGESHSPETHLIPNVLKSALGDGPSLRVFGQDYDTPDGTCVRDYVHVNDLAQAHLLALDWMTRNPGFSAFNLGNGLGFSVLEVIEAARRVTKRNIPFDVEQRRPGDPARLVASADLARSRLGWEPAYREIGEIIETAWRWHCTQRY